MRNAYLTKTIVIYNVTCAVVDGPMYTINCDWAGGGVKATNFKYIQK